MEYPGGGGAVLSSGNVPAFLTKLWTLVEDPDTDPLICWSPSGTSFHVFDQGRFSKEVLPKFFKHNNMASFIRQLNMCEWGYHHCFFFFSLIYFLGKKIHPIRRVSSVRQDDAKICAEEVNKILNDVQLMKGKQETIDSRIVTMKHENEALWREVASLRQKHTQQQKVVNKVPVLTVHTFPIIFLCTCFAFSFIHFNSLCSPLMLNDSGNTHSMPKYSRPFSLEQAAANLFSADTSVTSGPIISDITDMATSGSDELASDWTDQGQSVDIKEEPSSPEVEVCPVLEEVAAPVDTPLSPTTFINSILEENEPPTPVTSMTASPIVVMSPVSTGPLTSASSTQSLTSVTTANTAPSTTTPQKKCQAIACIDRITADMRPNIRPVSPVCLRSELLDHVDSIDSGLENLQNILNTQTFSFDTVPLIEFFSSSGSPADFDLDSLDNLLSDEAPKGSEESGTGKQLVQYTPVQTSESDSGADLPALLELETEPFLSSDPHTEDPGTTLLNHVNLDSHL
uniref:Heat shock transcription factor 1 n=1 Tax=Neolamprologus brichardi TaxID=32507 RepID=A0A3Q4IAJ6_NEOBR